MFGHLFRYRLLSMIKNKEVTFWNIIFPLALGTMFFFGFGRFVNEEDSIEQISIAVVKEDEVQNTIFSKVMEQMEGEDALFSFDFYEEDKAKEKLEAGDVNSIIVLKETPALIIEENGIQTSIVKNFLDQYIRKQAMIEELIQDGKFTELEQVTESLVSSQKIVATKELGQGNNNIYAQYFYALIAMCCLFASTQGAGCVNDIQANMSPIAARKGVAPVSKMCMVISEALAAILIQSATVVLLICYLKYVLKLELGEKTGLMMLTGILGGMFGISMGFLVGCIKKDFNTKIGILTGISMTMCFLSGLMIVTIKGVIEDHLPFLNRINPATLLTECFYCLNVYEDYKNYLMNLSVLAGFTVACFAVSIFLLKGARYESI